MRESNYLRAEDLNRQLNKYKVKVKNVRVIADPTIKDAHSPNCVPADYDPDKDYFEISDDMVFKKPVSFLDPTYIAKEKEQ